MRADRSTLAIGSALLLAGVTCAACGGDDAPPCIEPLPADCAPMFDPSWTGVYDFVIEARCGGSAAQCHGPDGRNGNLALYEKDGSYRALLGMDGTPSRVDPDDLACSPLMERLFTDDEERRMPKGTQKLSDGALCAVQKWIEQGAKP